MSKPDNTPDNSNNNPYQAPKAPVDIPPEPPTPAVISWVYVMVGFYFLLSIPEAVLIFLNDTTMSGNLWFFVGSIVLNAMISWWVFDAIKRRHRLSWLLPALIVLLTLITILPPDDEVINLLLAGGQMISMSVVLTLLFMPTGRKWRYDSTS